jgi:hypothetical protein
MEILRDVSNFVNFERQSTKSNKRVKVRAEVVGAGPQPEQHRVADPILRK